MRTAEAQAEAVLTPDQDRRLHEIQIQLDGERAALRKEVQDHLGLSMDQVAKLKELDTNYRAANLSIRQKQQSNEIDRRTARADQQKNTETLTEEIRKVLSPDQMARLKDMGGRPFVATEPMGRRRGGGGI